MFVVVVQNGRPARQRESRPGIWCAAIRGYQTCAEPDGGSSVTADRIGSSYWSGDPFTPMAVGERRPRGSGPIQAARTRVWAEGRSAYGNDEIANLVNGDACDGPL